MHDICCIMSCNRGHMWKRLESSLHEIWQEKKTRWRYPRQTLKCKCRKIMLCYFSINLHSIPSDEREFALKIYIKMSQLERSLMHLFRLTAKGRCKLPCILLPNYIQFPGFSYLNLIPRKGITSDIHGYSWCYSRYALWCHNTGYTLSYLHHNDGKKYIKMQFALWYCHACFFTCSSYHKDAYEIHLVHVRWTLHERNPQHFWQRKH